MLPTLISSVICSACLTASTRAVRWDFDATSRMSGGLAVSDVWIGTRSPSVASTHAPTPAAPMYTLAGDGVGDRADGRAAVDRQADHDDEAGVAGDEVARAVDRIDHPDAPPPETFAGVGDLLGQDDVVGKRLGEARDDERVGRDVGVGDRFVARLGADGQLLAVVAAHQLAGLARDAGRDVDLAIEVAHDVTAAACEVAAQRRAPREQHQPGHDQQQAGGQHRQLQADAVGHGADDERRERVAEHVDGEGVDRDARGRAARRGGRWPSRRSAGPC